MASLSLAIVGADYPNKRGPTRWFEIALCKPGELVELRLEPENKADEWAIAVYSCRGVQLGYIPSQRAPLVHKWIKEGREMATVYQQQTTYGAVLRLALDGEVPEVDPDPPAPGRRESLADGADEDFGFAPDPVWEDE